MYIIIFDTRIQKLNFIVTYGRYQLNGIDQGQFNIIERINIGYEFSSSGTTEYSQFKDRFFIFFCDPKTNIEEIDKKCKYAISVSLCGDRFFKTDCKVILTYPQKKVVMIRAGRDSIRVFRILVWNRTSMTRTRNRKSGDKSKST